MYKYYQLNLLVLTGKFDQKSNFPPQMAWSRPYKSQIGPKEGENFILKSRERYYIISMHKYKLTFFLSLIGKFDQKSNFHPRMAWSRPYKSQIEPKQGENFILKSRECGIILFLCTNTN